MHPPRPTPAVHACDFLRQADVGSWEAVCQSQAVELTYSGRAAIYQYLRWLRDSIPRKSARQTILLPAFHCPNVVDPVVHAGFSPRFYAMRRDLQIDDEDLRNKLDDDIAAVLMIGYFGLHEIESGLIELAHDAGARVIADYSHSFLSASPLRLALCPNADAITYSFWKFLPGQVGGGLVVNDPDRYDFHARFQRPRVRDVVMRHRNLLGELAELTKIRERLPARRRMDRHLPSVNSGPAERKPASESYPYDPRASSWRMPIFARRILLCADLAAIAAARRRNYLALLAGLHTNPEMRPVFGRLPEHAVPWGLPVYMNRRSERDYLMRRQGVGVFTFGETLHPLLYEQHAEETAMIADATFLADNLLAFSIHQGLAADYFHRVAPIINQVIQDH